MVDRLQARCLLGVGETARARKVCHQLGFRELLLISFLSLIFGFQLLDGMYRDTPNNPEIIALRGVAMYASLLDLFLSYSQPTSLFVTWLKVL